jgi:pimeloyl-ACP methyl ester carboxylesterase
MSIKDNLAKPSDLVGFHIPKSAAASLEVATAGRAAFESFCCPPVQQLDQSTQRLIDHMTPLFNRATSVQVASADGDVQAYLWRGAGVFRGRVILVHGWSGRAMVMGLFVEPLLRAGFDVVALDLPAHGCSGGTRLSMPIGGRAVQAVAHFFQPVTAAITHSFGGPVLALAMEGGRPLTHALKLDRAVLIAAPNKLSAMTDRFATSQNLSPLVHAELDRLVAEAARRPIETVQTGAMLERAGTPSLIIHDELDGDVPYDRALAICASAPNATLMTTCGLGHTRIIISSAVVRASVKFLAGVLPMTEHKKTSNI